MELDDALVNSLRGLEHDWADGGFPAPSEISMAVPWERAQGVERGGPCRVGPALGFEVRQDESSARLLAKPGGTEHFQRAGNGIAQHRGIEVDLLGGFLDDALEPGDFLAEVVVAGAGGFQFFFENRFGLRVAERIEFPGERLRLLAADARFESARNDIGEAAEFLFDRPGFARQDAQDLVLRAIGVEKVAAVDLGGLLELAVDAAVALFHAGGIPWHIKMEKLAAMRLEVEPLAGGVGADKNSDRVLVRRHVERPLEFLLLLKWRGTVKHLDALGIAVGACDGRLELLDDVALRVVPLGENDHAPVGPRGTSFRAAIVRQDSAGAKVLTDPLYQIADLGIRAEASPLGDRRHFRQKLALPIFGRNTRSRPHARCPHVGRWLGLLTPNLFHRPPVDAQRPGKGLDGRKQALLELGDEQLEVGPLAFRKAREPVQTKRAVAVEQIGQHQFGNVLWQQLFSQGGRKIDLHDISFWEPRDTDVAQVILEAAHHHRVAVFLRHPHPANEPLAVEDLKERGKAVAVAVVGGCGEEKTVLEAGSQLADGLRNLRVDRVFRAAGRCRMVGLVEDQQRAGPEVVEPCAHRAGVGFVDE